MRDYAGAIPPLTRPVWRARWAGSARTGDIAGPHAPSGKARTGVCSNSLKSQPDSADRYLLWGEAYASQYQDANAEREFRRALELSPKLPWAHFDLGLLEIHQHRLEAAQQEFDANWHMNPTIPELDIIWHSFCFVQQKPQEALPLLKQVVREKPEYAEAHYSLGKLILEQGRTSEAVTEFRPPLNTAPRRTTLITNLDGRTRKAGRLQDAEKEFKWSKK